MNATTKLDTWQDFTKRIYKEWDADPGYYALQSIKDANQQDRLAVAWCTYYNLGIAADASEKQGKKFWDYLRGLYPTAKRATERRHFRGAAGLKALDQWESKWPNPEALAHFMCGELNDGGLTYFDIRRRGQQVAQYGDYFYWKWCDLSEVLGYCSIDMTGSEKHSPKTPQQGAELIFNQRYPDDEFSYVELCKVYAYIVSFGIKNRVPPRTTDSRSFGLQEAETVCCVYKQMANGSYNYGTRTAKALRRLRAASSKTADSMAEHLLDLSPYTEKELNERLDAL